MLKKTFFSISLFLLAMLSARGQTALTYAPDFTIKTIKSETISLYEDLLDKNKIVVLDFFSVSCGPCQTFAHDFQLAYEAFGENQSNVFFLGVNYNGTVDQVIHFDSVYNISLPSCSGLEGGGNLAFETFQVSSYPTVVVIQPDRTITHQRVWEPTANNIITAVLESGGMYLGASEIKAHNDAVLEVYPQPASNWLNFRANLLRGDQARCQIKDINGKTLISNAIEITPLSGLASGRLDVDRLKSGTYILELISGDRVLRKKFVINQPF